jgi:hypothetical protein
VSFILVFISILNDYDPALFLVTPAEDEAERGKQDRLPAAARG